MAKGIVVKRPDGMTAGKIIVTDPTSSGVISGGGGGDVIGGTAAAIDPGTLVSYSETNSSGLGDLVDFTYDGRSASSIKTATKGTVLTGAITDNVKVGPADVITINGGSVDGKVVVKGGILVVIGNSVITGKLDCPVAGSYVMIDQQSTIDGIMKVTGASTISVRNSTIDGKLATDGTLFTAVVGCTIKGKLKVLNAKDCYASGNTIDSGMEGTCRS